MGMTAEGKFAGVDRSCSGSSSCPLPSHADSVGLGGGRDLSVQGKVRSRLEYSTRGRQRLQLGDVSMIFQRIEYSTNMLSGIFHSEAIRCRSEDRDLVSASLDSVLIALHVWREDRVSGTF